MDARKGPPHAKPLEIAFSTRCGPLRTTSAARAAFSILPVEAQVPRFTPTDSTPNLNNGFWRGGKLLHSRELCRRNWPNSRLRKFARLRVILPARSGNPRSYSRNCFGQRSSQPQAPSCAACHSIFCRTCSLPHSIPPTRARGFIRRFPRQEPGGLPLASRCLSASSLSFQRFVTGTYPNSPLKLRRRPW